MTLRRWIRKSSTLSGVVFILLATFAYCEYLIYYAVQFQCNWPKLEENSSAKNEDVLKALFIADTHLLGPFRGHWFDKLRREWQMHRAYTAAVSILKPDVVFFLGDVFDEGQWVNDVQFTDYVERFYSLFPPLSDQQHQIIVGNHDIGFHYVTNEKLQNRFDKAFSRPSTELRIVKNISFVTVNSVAMEEDGCHLCEAAEDKLQKIARQVHKSEQRPILLQHFPLYRESDRLCEGEDAVPEVEKSKPFKPKWDCLSQSSSKWLLDTLNPRVVLSGHTHHGCIYRHGDILEHSVASFSWRNRNNPSYLMGKFTKTDFVIAKCFIPRESTVVRLYVFSGVLVLAIFAVKLISMFQRKKTRSKAS